MEGLCVTQNSRPNKELSVCKVVLFFLSRETAYANVHFLHKVLWRRPLSSDRCFQGKGFLHTGSGGFTLLTAESKFGNEVKS